METEENQKPTVPGEFVIGRFIKFIRFRFGVPIPYEQGLTANRKLRQVFDACRLHSPRTMPLHLSVSHEQVPHRRDQKTGVLIEINCRIPVTHAILTRCHEFIEAVSDEHGAAKPGRSMWVGGIGHRPIIIRPSTKDMPAKFTLDEKWLCFDVVEGPDESRPGTLPPGVVTLETEEESE